MHKTFASEGNSHAFASRALGPSVGLGQSRSCLIFLSGLMLTAYARFGAKKE
jgi:hypothetical protein